MQDNLELERKIKELDLLLEEQRERIKTLSQRLEESRKNTEELQKERDELQEKNKATERELMEALVCIFLFKKYLFMPLVYLTHK